MKISPAARISIALVTLTCSIIMIGDLIGLAPSPGNEALEARRKFCEALAVVVSLEMQNDQVDAVRSVLDLSVERNEDILSMALRSDKGDLIVSTQAHANTWQAPAGGESTPSHWRVPIVKGEALWGTVEVRYTELPGQYVFGVPINPLVRLLLFVAVIGFVVYRFFIRKTLKHLDPSAVIPKQVQATLDVLAEGVAIFDRNRRIVLTNAAFSEAIGQSSAQLLGRRAEDLGFSSMEGDEASAETPWESAISSGKIRTGVKLTRSIADDAKFTYVVNGAPVLDSRGSVKGALATFSDMTQLEEKNNQLQKMLNLLKRSRDEVSRQNEQLKVLATSDPLTGCLNRRAFFSALDPLFEKAVRKNQMLVCIMTDIDHFKLFNDRYGHSVGDEVIKRVARCLQSTLREEDVLCRYGGEEFCIVLPELDIGSGMKVAERIRRMIESQNDDELEVTCSFGISALAFGAMTPEELIDQADKALYAAKDKGRNVVIEWHDGIDAKPLPTATATATAPSLALIRSMPADKSVADKVPAVAAQTQDLPGDQEREHLKTLEQDNRWFTEALEILTSMNNLYGDAAVQSDEPRIYNATRQHLARLISFDVMSFFAFDDEAKTFEMVYCEPETMRDQVQEQVDILHAGDELEWAGHQNHPVEKLRDADRRRFLLHSLMTDAGPTGLFVGLMGESAEPPNYTICNLLSIILNNTAGALASAKLHGLLNRQKAHLESALVERTREVEHSLVHDGLTGLPNRLLFRDRVDAAIGRAARYSGVAAVLLLDLDRFKRINKLLGQATGDELLKEASERIGRVLRSTDSIARLRPDEAGPVISRLGGDEFGILLTDLDDAKGVAIVVDRLMKSLSSPFRFGDREVCVTSSIGISIYPTDGDTAELLLRNSESAMYVAKQVQQNKYHFYCDETSAESNRQLVLEDQLRQAMKNSEFELHYQPKVNLHSGAITGFEALLRWSRPQHGPISPAEFIPVAESSGLIGPIGAWVLRAACAQARCWIDEGFPDIHVAVNLSAVQLRQAGILNQIMTILRETRLPPKNLQLEITESAIMQHIDQAAAILKQLSEVGISIAIDDFGTGYSSLSHLKRLPVDLLKIDGSFVRDLVNDADDAAIVTAIVAMAHSMGIETVAECVEDLEQTAFLQDMGCDQIQGYLYSRPLPVDDASEILRKEQSVPEVPWIRPSRSTVVAVPQLHRVSMGSDQ